MLMKLVKRNLKSVKVSAGLNAIIFQYKSFSFINFLGFSWVAA